MPDLKVATCCYCGRRTTLRLTARDGHELACGSCGAPLHEMKAMRPKAAAAASSHAPVAHPVPMKAKRKKKKSKSFWGKMAKEVWDELEDIFD